MFPDEILEPFVPFPADAAVPSPGHTDDEENFEPIPSPPKGKAVGTSGTVKSKKTGSSKKGKENVTMPVSEVESESNFEVTPSPPPVKKRKTTSVSKKGKGKMTLVEIRHYYSSFDEEPTPMTEDKQAGESQVEATMQPLFKAMEAQEESEDSDVAITKEVRTGSSRTLERIA